MKITRRDWILGSLSVAGWAAIASAQQHAHAIVTGRSGGKLDVLDPLAAVEVASIAARIIPSTDGPGATEAGAMFFIDRSLHTFAEDKQNAYRTGLADLAHRRLQMFPASESFNRLSEAEQIQLLKSIETTDFFALIRTHTILAWLGSPEYGGNRNSVGWKYIGFDDAGAFDPPFGFYDAEAK